MFVCFFCNVDNGRCIVGIYILLCKLFSLYSLSWVGAVSNMCDNCLFLIFSGLPHAISFVYELLINPFANFWEIHKLIIRLKEIFHHQICIHFSARFKKSKNSDGTPGHSPFTLQNIWDLVPPSCLKTL